MYQIKKFKCKKCGIEYTIESDYETKENGLCSDCKSGGRK